MLYLNNQPITVTRFPDGTPLFRLNTQKYMKHRQPSENLHNICNITWKYDDDSELLLLYMLVKHLHSQGYHNLTLQMPYIPNARFDRVRNEDEVFTLKYFADFINNMQFSKVTALDPHSTVSEALLNNFTPLSPDLYIHKTLCEMPRDKKLVFYFPDEGAMKRYTDIANIYNVPIVFGIKHRDWKTGEIQKLEIAGAIEELPDSTVLMIDDICSKGGTFYFGAKALKEAGASDDIYLYISHCENTIMEGKLITSNLIKQIFTTDSIYRENAIHPMITVFKI